MFGVSVAICCHNSARRLPTTLEHLRAQEVSSEIPWEVMIVDNASTDDTVAVARKCWPVGIAPLRIVPEPRLGLSHARHCAFAEANYAIVAFLDDDNWVCTDWVRLVAEIMVEHPEIGACNGFGRAACEISPPFWFEQVKGAFAVSTHQHKPGDATWNGPVLFGAGLVVRKAAWESLEKAGFQFLLADRQGAKLSSGGDTELCYALRLAGWRLWREPRLEFQHFIEAHRLNWGYVRRLHRACGAASVSIDIYDLASKSNPPRCLDRLRERWQWRLIYILENLADTLREMVCLGIRNREGQAEVLKFEHGIGRLSAMLTLRGDFNLRLQQLRQSSITSNDSVFGTNYNSRRQSHISNQ